MNSDAHCCLGAFSLENKGYARGPFGSYTAVVALARTKTELRHTCAKVRSYLEDGKTHEEICRLLGWEWSRYEELVKEYYAQESEDVRNRTSEQLYVDYVREQTRNIRDLTSILEQFQESKQHSAMVGAVRARSDIYDKIIDRGQQFGLIDKKPETKLVAGMFVAQLTNKDLRTAITEELGHLNSLMSRYGDGKNLQDVDPGPLHLSTPKQKAAPAPKTQPARHARNRVHGGRRVVKEQD